LSQAEADIGKDILYQAVQQGFNELLDPIFKEKEDEWLQVCQTRHDRQVFRKQREEFQKQLDAEEQQRDAALEEADRLRTDELLQPPYEPHHPDVNEFLQRGSESPQPDVKESDAVVVEDLAEHTSSDKAVSNPPDPEDHIELMFGNGFLGRRQKQPESDASESSYHDPTLPQFRPDDDHQPAGAAEAISPPPPNNPLAEDPVQARLTYNLWLRHDRIDEETEWRGGPGKLNFAEFRRQMRAEDDVGKALGSKAKDKQSEDVWESSADLGRLAFIGTWLEMASF
jgi:hypothetical protein